MVQVVLRMKKALVYNHRDPAVYTEAKKPKNTTKKRFLLETTFTIPKLAVRHGRLQGKTVHRNLFHI